MGYTNEEEPSVCPDEFDDFVTFEASMSRLNQGMKTGVGGVVWDLKSIRDLTSVGMMDAQSL